MGRNNVAVTGEDVDLGIRLFLNKNIFVLNESLQSFHWPHPKEMANIKEQSAVAAKKIHKKYGLWETSFYGLDESEEKYSLNKAIVQLKS